MGYLYLVTTDWIFEIGLLCENSINHFINLPMLHVCMNPSYGGLLVVAIATTTFYAHNRATRPCYTEFPMLHVLHTYESTGMTSGPEKASLAVGASILHVCVCLTIVPTVIAIYRFGFNMHVYCKQACCSCILFSLTLRSS